LGNKINSRFQKGGALLDDMRLLVQDWRSPEPSIVEVHGRLGKNTLARTKDTLSRAFRPRFVSGTPPNSWRICQEIEKHSPDLGAIQLIYYYFTAKSERLLYLYAVEELYSRFNQSAWDIRSEDKPWNTGPPVSPKPANTTNPSPSPTGSKISMRAKG